MKLVGTMIQAERLVLRSLGESDIKLLLTYSTTMFVLVSVILNKKKNSSQWLK